MSPSRHARGASLLSIVFLVLGAYGCDQLGIGGKAEPKKDTAKAEEEEDDSKDKKKKKKKKGKDGDDEEADADDASESAAPVAGTAPPPVPVAPAAAVAADAPTGNATCDAYLKSMDCIMGKMPPQARESFAQSKSQMEQAFKSAGSHAEAGCKAALDAIQPTLAQHGCPSTASAGATPPSPVSPPTTPTPPSQPATSTGGNSAVPTTSEWDSVTNEVTVRGSSALNCETKGLREWVRVSCRGKNSTGGTPTTINITSGGGRGNEFVFASGGVTSLVVRFLEGVDLKVDFGWTDGSHSLHVWWPRGAPDPPAKGVFTRN